MTEPDPVAVPPEPPLPPDQGREDADRFLWGSGDVEEEAEGEPRP